jgi:hypothetical protein
LLPTYERSRFDPVESGVSWEVIEKLENDEGVMKVIGER